MNRTAALLVLLGAALVLFGLLNLNGSAFISTGQTCLLTYPPRCSPDPWPPAPWIIAAGLVLAIGGIYFRAGRPRERRGPTTG